MGDGGVVAGLSRDEIELPKGLRLETLRCCVLYRGLKAAAKSGKARCMPMPQGRAVSLLRMPVSLFIPETVSA